MDYNCWYNYKKIYSTSYLYVERAMAPHSGTLAWKMPWTEEPGRLQSMGSLRVGHDWVTSLSLFTFIHWRRKWQPTPVFLPGVSQGWGSLVGCGLWGRTTEVTWQQQQQQQLSIWGIRILNLCSLIVLQQEIPEEIICQVSKQREKSDQKSIN